MITLPSLVDWLHYEFPGGFALVRDIGSYSTYVRGVCAQAYPELGAGIEAALVQSRRRECRQFRRADGTALIAVDLSLVRLFAIQDALLFNSFGVENKSNARMLAGAMLAETLYDYCQPDRAALCLSQSAADATHINAMARAASARPGLAVYALFILLHELAHLAVDAQHPLSHGVADVVRRAIARQREECGKLADALESGDWTNRPLVSVNASDPALLARQLRASLMLTEDDDEIAREASCDVLACVGLIQMRAGIDILRADGRRADGVGLREVADLMAVGLRASRLLMARSAALEMAQALVYRSNPAEFERPFAQMSLRSNSVINVLTMLFDGICARDDLPSDASVSPSAMAQAFVDEVGILQHISDALIFEPVEDLLAMLRNEAACAAAQVDLAVERFGKNVVGPKEWNSTVSAFLERLEI